METLTDRQREIYDFIVKFRNEKGYSPSFREIGKGCFLSSMASVSRHIDILVRKGYISYIPSEPRTIRPTK